MTVANGHDEPSAADVSAKINLAQSSRSAKVGSHDVTSGIELGANAIDDFPLACRRRRHRILAIPPPSPEIHPLFGAIVEAPGTGLARDGSRRLHGRRDGCAGTFPASSLWWRWQSSTS